MNKQLFKRTKIGDIVCYLSYGSAKTWGRVSDIKMVKPRDIHNRVIVTEPEYQVMVIQNTYYKSYYDNHLTGRTSGTTTLGEGYNYPIFNRTLELKGA